MHSFEFQIPKLNHYRLKPVGSMATESRPKPCLLAHEISAEGANHISLAQRARTMARIRSRAEGPPHNFGPGFQPLNHCFLSTWRVAPGWYESGLRPFCLKQIA
jgi:hypothetical protein